MSDEQEWRATELLEICRIADRVIQACYLDDTDECWSIINAGIADLDKIINKEDPVPSGTEDGWGSTPPQAADVARERSSREEYEAASKQVTEDLLNSFRREWDWENPKTSQGIKAMHERYEPTEKAELMDLGNPPAGQALDLAVTLPGEQVAVALISLIETMWESMTPEQQQTWNDWLIEDQKAWRKFWKVGE